MADSRKIESAAAAWLAQRDAGPWTAHDQQALEAWLAESTAHRVALLRLQSAWTEAGRLQALAAGLPEGEIPPRDQWSDWIVAGAREPVSVPMDAVGSAVNAAPDLRALAFAPRPRATRSARWPSAAAAAAVLFLAAGLGWGGWQLGGRHQASYASAIGEVREVVLADGSRATLSSDSRLDLRFDRGQRHVALVRGEAFFDVAHDRARPFVVEADGHRAVAVGTRYAVRRDAETLRVVVTEGRVRLESAPGADGRAVPSALLPAGSLATAGREGVLVRSLPLAQAKRYLEWRKGFLAFEDVPLTTAADEFNRFNARRLELADPAVAQLRIGGNFRWSNLEGFVGLLEQGFPVRAERHPDRIVLHSR
ncbi:FecR domain-containing protein [Pseudoxanthomonas daejeonensis]|uniref:FecR family protein n=1 Tax=Pseudoxanthomonas daejeonensis TaxID=266062 RepID=UPI001F546DE0|nr:FecR domain-containing protein [Pseudoxanthomonas daejeonensis]UNK58553.1 FecR domain-containing protein [Pseudoxanthomonas daejeonensis]